MIDVDSVLKKAQALCAQLPERKISAPTADAYFKEFKRMMASNTFDPLRDGIALDTYYHRRAALHFCTRAVLIGLVEKCVSAKSQQDTAAEQKAAKRLLEMVELLEPVLVLEPPMPDNVLPWERPPSRWHASANADRVRGTGSKKNVLAYLPPDWDSRLWQQATGGGEWRHLDALAVHLVVPVRPEELVPGRRPSGWSRGVQV